MANLLYIDTSGNTALVAITKNQQLTSIRMHSEAKQQAAIINLLIEEVLVESAIAQWQIAAINVCAGHGSYTGLRVGLATAKGLCYALNTPLVLFNKLELIAFSFGNKLATTNIAVALQARKDEYFFALFDNEFHALKQPQHIFETEFQNIIKDESIGLITDNTFLQQRNNTLVLSSDFCIDILQWMPMAELKWMNKKFDDIAYSEPFYLKAAYTTQSKKRYGQ